MTHTQDTPTPTPPTKAEILRVWLMLGAQSFGGGAATLALIRQAVVEQRGWLTEAEFLRDWALCQIAPGINLIGLTILIGRRLGGAWAIALALAGLLLPSAAATVLLTAMLAHWQHSVWVREALRGVVPATVGLGLLTAAQMARPALAVARREGRTMLAVGIILLAGAALAAAAGNWPTVAVLCAAGAVGAAAQWIWERQAARGHTQRGQQ